MHVRGFQWFTLAFVATTAVAEAGPITPLWARGHAVIPAPQKVSLPGSADEVVLDSSWSIDAGAIPSNHIALRFLRQDLRDFHALQLDAAAGGQKKSIHLAVRPGTVAVPGDEELAPQGYRLRVSTDGITIEGNGDAGLFYGVQTFVQLLKAGPRGALLLPECVIEDWPALQLRFLHWDTKNHQDRVETLKRYLDWSARFKANMIGFELGDKFEFPSNPEIGAPGAFTTAELQDLTRYAAERFVQIVPVIQGPSHLMYALKHPKFAALKADGNNYEATLCDERTYKLMFDLFDDVIQATPGVQYVFASTDEVYYASTGCTPDDADNRSRKWAEFAARAHDHLASKGRRMLAWLEYPLLAKHLNLIPSGVIDGVVGDAEYVPIEKSKGMRQLGYVSVQGAEFLFPDNLPLDLDLHDPAYVAGVDDPLEFERGQSNGRMQSVLDSLSTGRFRSLNPIGAFGAAWDDSGLHNETFWLGWAAAARWAWNPGAGSAEQHVAEFMQVYYGPRVTGMIEIYRSMQRQARTWQRTWDRVVSRVRGPGYGNSEGKGIGVARYDQTLTLPALPGAQDGAAQQFSKKYRAYLSAAIARQAENDILVHALQDNMGRADRNRYNIEVMLSLAHFAGHHWRLLIGLAEVERTLEQAAKAKPKEALDRMAAAYRQASSLEREGERVFADLTRTFEQSQYPKGRSFNGKMFLQVLDDTKDHWAGRTADWGYMQAPERGMGLGQWRKDLATAIAAFANRNNLPAPALRSGDSN